MLPTKCPSCHGRLRGTLEMWKMWTEERFIRPAVVGHVVWKRTNSSCALKSSSLKEMASLMKLSYPTVRNRLNEIIQTIISYEKQPFGFLINCLLELPAGKLLHWLAHLACDKCGRCLQRVVFMACSTCIWWNWHWKITADTGHV